jgi:hypothetical protein
MANQSALVKRKAAVARWRDADPGLPLVKAARKLVGEPEEPEPPEPPAEPATPDASESTLQSPIESDTEAPIDDEAANAAIEAALRQATSEAEPELLDGGAATP